MESEWTMMSSRQSLGAPMPHAQQGRDRAWREPACQRTRRTRQLGENESRGAVGPVSGEDIDAGHRGGEHRGGENGHRHSKQRAQDGPERAARSAGTALLFGGVAALRGRFRAGRRRVGFIGQGCHLMVPGCALPVAMVVRVLGRPGLLGGGGCRTAMVVRAAERHGRGSSALSGNRQNQQPDQKRSNQQTHPFTLPQPRGGVLTTTSLLYRSPVAAF